MGSFDKQNRRQWLLASALLAGCSTPSGSGTGDNASADPAEANLDQLLQYARGLERTQMVYAAADLGIADLLAGGPRSTDELAASSGARQPELYRLLRALTSLGMLTQPQPNVFGLTDLGQMLRSDHPEGLRDLVLWNGSGWRLRAWADIVHTVRTGETGMQTEFGEGLYAYLEDHPADAEVFNGVMTRSTRRIAGALAEAYNFTDVNTVADIGGGEGLLLATILRSAPALKGILFELPTTAQAAGRFLQEQGLGTRSEAVGGDFFESVPEADIYILMRVLQDWDNSSAVRILNSCRKSVRPGGRVLIIQKVVPADATDPKYPITDIHLMVQTGGHERTADQFQLLLERANFKMGRVIPLDADLGDGYPPSIIEGVA